MKKIAKKLLCLVLVLMMAMPIIVLPASAEEDGLVHNYADVNDGDLIYDVDFTGTADYWVPSTPWGGMILSDVTENSITLTPKSNTDRQSGLFGEALPNENDKSSNSKFRMNQSAYTVTFTLTAEDANQEIGFFPDWNSGFVINPGQNRFKYVKGYVAGKNSNKQNINFTETVFDYVNYEGDTGDAALTQTYAIEIKDEGSNTEQNDHSQFKYNITTYNLYVSQNGKWLKIFSFEQYPEKATLIKNSLKWGSGDWEFVLRLYRDYYKEDENKTDSDISRAEDPNQHGDMTVSDMNVYKGLAVNGIKAPTPYDYAENGDLLYTANFEGDSRYDPSNETAAANAGYNWVCDNITATVDTQDSGKATFKVTSKANTAWGADIDDLPLGEGYSYTIKFKVSCADNEKPIGLLFDGTHGGHFYAHKARIQRNGSALTGHSWVNYTEKTEQEYVIEINGDDTTFALYVKGEDGKWSKLDDGTPKEDPPAFFRDRLGLYFYGYYLTEVTVSDVRVYKGVSVVGADNYALEADGALLYTADFEGDSRWAPSAETAAANAGYNWPCDNITATTNTFDTGKATIKVTSKKNTAWGADIDDLPLGSGYSYTIKFTLTLESEAAALGVMFDGHHNTYVKYESGTLKARLQKNGSKLNNKDYVSFGGTLEDQEYIIEVDGDASTFAAYYKNSEGIWTLIDQNNMSTDTRDSLGLYFYGYATGEATVSNVLVYKGISVVETENAAGGSSGENPDDSSIYDQAEDGELLYEADFSGADDCYKPSNAAAAANAGYNWTCENITATVDTQDSGKVSVVTTTGNTAWGADIDTLPLGEGYSYTIKFSVTVADNNKPIGLLFDGHHGAYVYSVKGRLQKNGSALSGHSYKNYTASLAEQEYAIEVNGAEASFAVYYKNSEGRWEKIDEGDMTSDTRNRLGIYLYAYHATQATVSNVLVYKGLSRVAYENGVFASPSLIAGAAVRLDDPTGLRFTGIVGKDYFDALKEQYGENVTLGMLITPTDYLNGIEFTKAALDAADITGVKYLEIDATTVLTDGNYYKVNCAIVNINSKNYERAFSAILYIKANGEIIEYSNYSEENNSRTVKYIAEEAYKDLEDVQGTVKNGLTYSNPVVVGDVTKYSPYTEEQRGTLASFFQ